MHWLIGLTAFAAAGEVSLQLPEIHLRSRTMRHARHYARAHHKPLLNVGCPGPFAWNHACGDVCVDLEPEKLAHCRSAQPTPGSVTDLPFRDSQFAAATCFHVLEHLPSISDVRSAVGELERVADRAYLLVPARGLLATINADHKLWVHPTPTGLLVTDRRTKATGLVPLRNPELAR